MGELSTKQVGEKAEDLLRLAPAGLRYSELWKAIKEVSPATPDGTITGGLRELRVKASRAESIKGVWRLSETPSPDRGTPGPSPPPLREHGSYRSFADCLKDVREEVTEAKELGGSLSRKKWATPDVVGVLASRRLDAVQFPMELVVAEVKIAPEETITAYGQACAYRLFAHRVFLALPETPATDKADFDRIEALCALSGIGLVLFRPDPSDPAYRLAVPAQRHVPDMAYTAEFCRLMQTREPEVFKALFG